MLRKFKQINEGLHWKVGEKPVGKFSSFSKRSWPVAYNNSKQQHIISRISSEDDYKPQLAKTGDHKPLRVHLAIRNKPEEQDAKGSFTWRKLKAEFPRLEHAKQAAEEFYQKNRHMFMDAEEK